MNGTMPTYTTERRTKPIVCVRDLAFQYSSSSTPCITHASFDVHSGDRVLLIGHNGSGKSTLLTLLAGRRNPTSGEVRVMDRDPFDDTCITQNISLTGPAWPPEAFFATTVDQVTSPAPFPERKTSTALALHLNLSDYVDKMSSGEKRRTQILHSLLYPATVYLLDECSTDIDVAERRSVLELVRKECTEREGCCLYATHILDNIGDWATHVMLIANGRIVSFESVRDIQQSLEKYALQFMSCSPHQYPTFEEDTTMSSKQPEGRVYLSTTNIRETPEDVITCQNLTYKHIFANMSFNVRRGERVLLCGCNGSGKSTLLNMLGGKLFFPNESGALRVLGQTCYDSMTLNAEIAYGGDWWITVPGGEVHVHEMIKVEHSRAFHLQKLLAVDLDWDVRHISAGEQKRVQLLLHLLEDKPVVLLDEATADLDLDQRYRLLQFLYSESVCRGVTVVYSTHIFGGLDGWASCVIILDRMQKGVHAVWRQTDEQPIRMERLVEELVQLKAGENILAKSSTC